MNYSFGFRTTDKQYWLYYTLEGTNATTQIFLSAEQSAAVAQLFASAAGINYESTGKYFATTPRLMP